MATVRENRRERYLTFDPERRARFSNRWEIALVILIISAGIVITTIAAIKARGEFSATSPRTKEELSVTVFTYLSGCTITAVEVSFPDAANLHAGNVSQITEMLVLCVWRECMSIS